MSSNQFNKQHIEGKASSTKPINTQGNFDDPEKRYVSVRSSGDPKGTRVYGTRPGQKKAVVEDIQYKETRNTAEGTKVTDGSAAFMVTGKKDGKSMKPEHLDGQVVEADGRYVDDFGDVFSECSSSTSAYYSR